MQAHLTANRHRQSILLSLAFILSSAACFPNLQSGDGCEPAESGFTRYSPCIESCIDWTITCPSGEKLIPLQCSGVVCGDGTACQDDEECIQIDSFIDNSRCLKKTICE